MVGVQLDQAGHQQVALQVVAALGRRPSPISAISPSAHREPAAFDDAVGQHDPGVGQDESDWSRVLDLVIRHVPHAAAEKPVMSITVSAMRSRTVVVVDDGDDGRAAPLFLVDQLA